MNAAGRTRPASAAAPSASGQLRGRQSLSTAQFASVPPAQTRSRAAPACAGPHVALPVARLRRTRRTGSTAAPEPVRPPPESAPPPLRTDPPRSTASPSAVPRSPRRPSALRPTRRPAGLSLPGRGQPRRGRVRRTDRAVPPPPDPGHLGRTSIPSYPQPVRQPSRRRDAPQYPPDIVRSISGPPVAAATVAFVGSCSVLFFFPPARLRPSHAARAHLRRRERELGRNRGGRVALPRESPAAGNRERGETDDADRPDVPSQHAE